MHIATLRSEGISKTFIQGEQKITVLDTIHSNFISGNTYAITGISGSGKSTFIHILAGLEKPTNGFVYYTLQQHQGDQKEYICLQTATASILANFLNKSIGLVFQSPYLIRELSIEENIMLPGLIHGITYQESQMKAAELLEKIELSHKKKSKPGELSGGQQQRVAIARALFNKPAFLIADEPTGNLDLVTGKTIIDLLLSCHMQWGMGIIVSSHDDYVAQAMNEVYELSEGTLHKIK